MTALEKYIRLEAAGRWREAPGDAWREVLISFGNATLVLSSFDEEPLTHWSLAATERIVHEDGLAVYAPDAGTDEVLEVRDPDMIEAIAEVSQMARVRPRAVQSPRRLRRLVVPSLAVLALGAAALLGPDALRTRAYTLVTPEQAEVISNRVRAELNLPVCATPEGRRSLRRLIQRAAPGARAEVVVWDSAPSSVPNASVPPAVTLADGSVLLSRRLVERTSSAETVAGWLALANARGRAASSLKLWADDMNAAEALDFLTSGTVERADISEMVRLTREANGAPPPEALSAALAALAAATIDPQPFLRDIAARYPEAALPEAPAVEATPVLPRDADWVALQNICDI
ncbi:hypothetical protein ACW9UR_02920 [Halovulum sp. GXIMD14794]